MGLSFLFLELNLRPHQNMDLSEVFKYGVLSGCTLVLIANSRTGPEISRRLTNMGTMVFGASMIGWAVTSKPLTDGAWGGVGAIGTFMVAMIGAGSLLWGWGRRRRDREIDAGVLPDSREDPVSRVRRHRAEQKIRNRFASKPLAVPGDDDGLEAAARDGRSRAMVMIMLGATAMLAPLLFPSVRKGTIDGSPTSLLTLACIVLGALLTVVGRRRWVRYTRREQEALEARERKLPD